MSATTIRPARPEDFGAVLTLLQQAALPTQDLGDTRQVHFWVGEADGRIIGAGGLEQYGNAGLLRSLVVTPEARGRGLGIELVQTLERAAAGMGISRLVLLTQTARDFFEHRGYTAITRESAPAEVRASAEFRSLCPASAVCMIKSPGQARQPSACA